MSMADVFSFALAWDFPGLYLQLQEQDGTSSVAIGCLSPAWATLNVSKLICDQSSACQVYSDETFRAFAPSPGFKKITFMSTTRCAGAQKGVNIFLLFLFGRTCDWLRSFILLCADCTQWNGPLVNLFWWRCTVLRSVIVFTFGYRLQHSLGSSDFNSPMKS